MAVLGARDVHQRAHRRRAPVSSVRHSTRGSSTRWWPCWRRGSSAGVGAPGAVGGAGVAESRRSTAAHRCVRRACRAGSRGHRILCRLTIEEIAECSAGSSKTLGDRPRAHARADRDRCRARRSRTSQIGESIAVNGACLTVAPMAGEGFIADVMPETLPPHHPGRAGRRRDTVNLERALRFGDRVGGHMVSGHVDATGIVTALREDGNARWVTIATPDDLIDLVSEKGCIAVDGISLTVVDVFEAAFTVSLIPVTLGATVAGAWTGRDGGEPRGRSHRALRRADARRTRPRNDIRRDRGGGMKAMTLASVEDAIADIRAGQVRDHRRRRGPRERGRPRDCR